MLVVTGGAGFIGANFVLDWVKQSDEQVMVVDCLSYAGNLDNLASVSNGGRFDGQVLFSLTDLRDKVAIRDLVARHRPRAIVHFAAESHVDRSIDGPEAFIQTNVLGTYHLLEAATVLSADPSFRLVHVSTDEVYGSLGPHEPAFTEQHPYAPNSPYAASKAASDHLVRAWHHSYRLPAITTNCSNNYGPYQYPEKLIPLMISHALHGKPLPVYGDGGNVRDWLYVADHCAAIRAVLARGCVGEVYNIGGNAEMSNLALVRTLCALLDTMQPRSDGHSYATQISFVTDRPGHDRRYAINAAKLRAALGWQPAESFDSGIRKTIAWYLAHQDWVGRLEERRGLGDSRGAGVARVAEGAKVADGAKGAGEAGGADEASWPSASQSAAPAQ